VVLAPLKAVKRGAQSTPRSARPMSPPPLSREEGERRQGQDTGAPRPQGPEETVPCPWGYVSVGGCGSRRCGPTRAG